MDKNKKDDDRLERALAGAWHEQQGPEPSEAWYIQVMQAVGAEPGVPQIVPLAMPPRLLWRAACVAAAAAIVVAVIGNRIIPSDAGLAWQLQRDGVSSEWALLAGD